jgi:HSP20 family molecular chaperone IbpA
MVMAKDKETQSRQVAPRYSDPFGTLRSEMDRLFDSFMGGLPTFPSMFGSSGSRGFALSPSMDVKETDKDIVVETELPGLEEKDISLTVHNGILTIQGEKNSIMTRRRRITTSWSAVTAASSVHFGSLRPSTTPKSMPVLIMAS